MSQSISSTRELINILDSAEINAKEIQAVKDEVGYQDGAKDKEGNSVTLTQYIHNNIESYKERAKEAEAELKGATQEYVKSQCDRTHVLVERKTLKEMAQSCEGARSEVDNIEYDAEECENYARGINGSMSDAKSSIEYVEDDLLNLAEQDMPEEAMEASKPPAKKTGA